MDVGEWADFAVATAGASAALTGLVFVAVSINLARILEYPDLPARTGQTLVLFLAPLFLSLLVLARGQGIRALGVELVVLGLVVGAILFALSRRPAGQETKASSACWPEPAAVSCGQCRRSWPPSSAAWATPGCFSSRSSASVL